MNYNTKEHPRFKSGKLYGVPFKMDFFTDIDLRNKFFKNSPINTGEIVMYLKHIEDLTYGVWHHVLWKGVYGYIIDFMPTKDIDTLCEIDGYKY